MKKNVIENLVPVVISAKHLFEQKHSPLLRDMLCYLKELMQVQVTTPTTHNQSSRGREGVFLKPNVLLSCILVS